MKGFLFAALLSVLCGLPAQAANLVKSYSYFKVGGTTLEEIEAQLSNNGPHVKSTGHRHPGATRMAFTTRLGFAEQAASCRIVSAAVTVKAKVILPRWTRPRKADAGVRLFWDTLSSDIKRHEESHIVIARNYARDLEKALVGIGRQNDCQAARAKAKMVSDTILAKHDRAQVEFDRIEGANFESRLLRLLNYRIEQIEARRKPR